MCRFRLSCGHSFATAAVTLFLFVGNASSQILELPATGVWNGFLDHVNVVECANAGNEAVSVRVTIQDNQGSAVGGEVLDIAAHATRHLILNSYGIENQYGTYLLENVGGADTWGLSCLTAFYRMTEPGAPKPVEYAYAIPAGATVRGETAGVYNSIDPALTPIEVYNWLSVYNPGEDVFRGQVQVYRQDGSWDAEQSFLVADLQPGERRDYPLGHEVGQVVGLYRIIPEDTTQSYGALLTRFSQHADGCFAFAFPLHPQAGSCAPSTVPGSTFGYAYNWGEIANPTGEAIEFSIVVRDQASEVLYENDDMVLAPYSQVHVPLHEFLGSDNLGSLTVLCHDESDPTKKLIVESLFYGHLSQETLAVEWAYASQTTNTIAGKGDLVLSHINTFFNAPNWSKYLSASSSPHQLNVKMYDAAGALFSLENYVLAAGGTLDLGFHAWTDYDAIGFAVVESDGESSQYTSELIRVYPHESGSLGYIMNVPNRVIDAKERGDQGSSSWELAVSQYGITWTFREPREVGRFENGDFWVVGPVTITSITPAFDGERHGWEANPAQTIDQGFDVRAYHFNDTLVPDLPYEAHPGTSVVKAVSNLAPDAVCARNPYHTCYLKTAAVLTILNEAPPRKGVGIFRPPYFGTEKPLYDVSDLHLEHLPSVAHVSSAPTLEWIEERFRRVQIDHKENWVGRTIHPDENMPDYGGDIALNTGDAALRLMLDDPIGDKLPALIHYVQMGIDWYHILKNGGSWISNGGHSNGRKLPIILTAILFENQEMKDAVMYAPYNTFQEDGHVYFSPQADGGAGEVLFGDPSYVNYWFNQVTDGGSRTARDPYGYIDGGHVPGTSYQRGVNSMIWKGPVITMQLMPEINTIWNNEDFIAYVDRWVTFGAWAQPDPCAPTMGRCVGGSLAGEICTYADPEFCTDGSCGGGFCDGGPYDGQACSDDGGPSPAGDCGTYPCRINPEFFEVTYGPDPNNPDMCILDTDPSDGIGRHPYQHGANADSGVYHSRFTNDMWNAYRLYHCFNGIRDQDEEGVDCGGSCVYDDDGDGYLGRICSSGSEVDCDDGDPFINPGMPEICTKAGEVDDNCDGVFHSSYYVDTDLDEINDCEDNCPADCNPDQGDSDFDGIGDACDDAFTSYEDFELMSGSDIGEKTTPSGLSFEVVSGGASIGAETHWGYQSNFLRMTSDSDEGADRLVVTNEGRAEWSKYTLSLIAGDKYTASGIVLHYQNPLNYYWVDLHHSQLQKVQNGVVTVIDGSGDSISMDWGGANHHYEIQSMVGPGVAFQVVKDGTTTRTFSDANPHTDKGSIGFFVARGYGSGNYLIVDNIEILFDFEFTGPTGPCQ